ncbi:Stk1 family PASTA domain-containing Ser/Thr kinase [Cellulomonas triticagri]|uniref:non-specific serine/threonine protein kinase n=1 Tax=Cellulomonas triticagri TaxID=2483352 RepID=A0A3M2J6R5_9CELL|nr:Stk1 family PASTA domain-containing Ser/Thr kinase [Cellulomonas triticagri]RMI09807.1 Stk1 family PASTA domain-containing Ser/Thr kinase [Cellulomonas triticagri]
MGATVTDPLVGQLVDGRYEVVQRIARGGMATVYLAVDRRLDRDVALKVMHPHLAEGGAGADFVARFRREARAAARLTHPGLVGVYDQGLDGETSYLTMEYVDGVNLRRHLAERGSLTVGETLDVAERVLDALAAAHRAGLVHRDIKPENVLMAEDGRVKVADFGLARAVTEVTSTTTGTVFGTVAYLAPELVVKGTADARTDVYAAGVLVYEMLTGAQPFTGETPIQIAFQHVNSDVPAPSDAASWLPVEIDELVGALAAREPDDRPGDAAAALALLRRTRTALDEATLARRVDVPPSVALPHATDPEDDDAPAPAATRPDQDDDEAPADATTRIDTPGRTVALPIGAITPGGPVPTGDTATGARRSRRRWWWIAAAVLLLAGIGGGTWWYLQVGPGAYTTVPEVTTLTEDDAVALLRDNGLGADPVATFDDDAPAGTVFAAEPAVGDQVRKDGTVTISVSRGPDLVAVPADLVGKMQDQARDLLAAADLNSDVVEGDHWDDAAAIGSVLATTDADGNPVEAGAQVKRGSTVFLTLSDGPEPVRVTSVVNTTLEQATAQLEELGLVVAAEEAFSDTVPAGTVISQSPESGADAKRTDTVTLQVSKGPETVPMPNLTGKQYDEAARVLEGLGLKAERRNVLGGLFGTVRDQSVPADQAVPKGSTITLTVV